MDLIDGMLANHGTLRGSLMFLGALLDRPCGCGWDDLAVIDQDSLARELAGFMEALKRHEALEAEYMESVLRIRQADRELTDAVSAGHRAVEDLARIFGAVASSGDGEHVHRLRTVLERLTEEVEIHLAYEERVVFPLLRARLTHAELRELGRRALAHV